jgi:hypothetical protein
MRDPGASQGAPFFEGEMTETNPPTAAGNPPQQEALAIDLRDPWLAAFLAWLVPGLGHMYQRRWGKGGLYMTCILGTFFYGLWLGGGRVVYASFRDNDSNPHYAYLCQVGVGLPALPAVVQAMRVGGATPKAPLLDGVMAPPMVNGQIVPRAWVDQQQTEHPGDKQFDSVYFQTYDGPDGAYYRYSTGGPHERERTDQLGQWQHQFGAYFDLGTVYTMIAGLLNILVIWDAWGGPATPAENTVDDKKTPPSGKVK